MPLYEYHCSACDRSFEVLQKVDDAAPASCQLCERGPVHKRMSRTGFILKGAGWYVTDFRDNKSKTSATPATDSQTSSTKTEASAPAAETKPTEAKTDTKPSSTT